MRENEIIVLTVTNLGFEGDQGVKRGGDIWEISHLPVGLKALFLEKGV